MLLHKRITGATLNLAHRVYNRLGYGFIENPYVGALHHELLKAGLRAEREAPIAVEYDGVVVGTYRMDLLIEGVVVLEAKAERTITGHHERQLRNYLKASRVEVGILFNFGPQPEFRRFIHTNDRKHMTEEGPSRFQ
jgi:GxxExxY protein